MDLLRMHDKDVVFANGGAALSFSAVQTCFQEHRTINKTCFARIIVIDPFKSHRAGSLFANAGVASPPTSALF